MRSRYRPEAFLGERLLEALAAADLVVGRAGSSTLAEVAAFGLPFIVVPYPHAGAHQRANAAELVDAGAAQLVEDEAFDAEALVNAVALLDEPARHAAMAAAARSQGPAGRRRRGRRDPARPRGAAAAPQRRGRDPARRPGARSRGVTNAAAPLDLVALGGDIARRVGVKAERNAPLAKLTTMRVGGPGGPARDGAQRRSSCGR